MKKITLNQYVVWSGISFVSLFIVFLFVAISGFGENNEPIGSSGVFIPLLCAIIPLLLFRFFLFNNNVFLPMLSLSITVSMLLLFAFLLNSLRVTFLAHYLELFFASGSWLGWCILFVIILLGPYLIIHMKSVKRKQNHSRTSWPKDK